MFLFWPPLCYLLGIYTPTHRAYLSRKNFPGSISIVTNTKRGLWLSEALVSGLHAVLKLLCGHLLGAARMERETSGGKGTGAVTWTQLLHSTGLLLPCFQASAELSTTLGLLPRLGESQQRQFGG